jgi:hypothetical protein
MSFGKCVAIISLYFCGLAHAHADEPRREGAMLRLGGFVGGGFDDWFGTDADGMLPGERAVSKPGFSAGLLATLDLSRLLSLDIEPLHLAIQPEFVYTTRGAGIERDGEDRGSFNLSYLQAGLLLKFGYPPMERATPYLLLGPELGLLRQAELENILGNTSNIEGDLKSTNFGVILGVGTMFEVPPYGALGLELRADLGLVSIDGQGDGDEIRNAALTLLLAYLY